LGLGLGKDNEKIRAIDPTERNYIQATIDIAGQSRLKIFELEVYLIWAKHRRSNKMWAPLLQIDSLRTHASHGDIGTTSLSHKLESERLLVGFG
jgi:hypothetical protein